MALELIHETRVFPELEYTFKHALTQEVAYGSLPGQLRKELHRLIAVTIEDLYVDRLAEQYEVLAQHFEKAEIWDKALEYLMRAADKAARAFATRDAIALYDAAEATAHRVRDGAPLEKRMAIQRGRAELYVLVSDFDRARAEWEGVQRLARRCGDRQAEGQALVAMGQASWLGHHFDQSLDDSRQAAKIAEAIDAPSILAGSLLNGDLALAREYLQGVHRLVKDPATSKWMCWRYSIHLFASLGELALARGDLDGAHEHADECLERATRTRSRKYLVKGWRLCGEIAKARRMWEDADNALREALAVAEFIGNPTQLWATHMALGQLHSKRKTPEAAQQAYDAARNVIEHMKSGLRNPRLRASLESTPLIRRVDERADSGEARPGQ